MREIPHQGNHVEAETLSSVHACRLVKHQQCYWEEFELLINVLFITWIYENNDPKIKFHLLIVKYDM